MYWPVELFHCQQVPVAVILQGHVELKLEGADVDVKARLASEPRSTLVSRKRERRAKDRVVARVDGGAATAQGIG